MVITITEKLKELRKSRGNTQEELANHLNISVQAVSKWERGDGLPDISHLPKIASFYDVTVDELLGCDKINQNEEIEGFLEQCHSINNKGNIQELLALCREMQSKYPHDERVLCQLMHALSSISRNENSKEIISIGKKLIASTDEEHRSVAIHTLCYTYSAIGEKDTALEYAKMVPVYEDLVVAVLEGEELARHCKNNLWHFCGMMGLQLNRLISAEKDGYTNAEKHTLRKMLEDMYGLIFSEGDFGFWEDRLGRNSFEMAVLSALCGNNELALSELEAAFAHFEKSESFVSIDHTSLAVRGVHYEESMSVKNYSESIFCEYTERLNNKCFNAVRENSRFIDIARRFEKKTVK